jgi:hypothetical protein
VERVTTIRDIKEKRKAGNNSDRKENDDERPKRKQYTFLVTGKGSNSSNTKKKVCRIFKDLASVVVMARKHNNAESSYLPKMRKEKKGGCTSSMSSLTKAKKENQTQK